MQTWLTHRFVVSASSWHHDSMFFSRNESKFKVSLRWERSCMAGCMMSESKCCLHCIMFATLILLDGRGGFFVHQIPVYIIIENLPWKVEKSWYLTFPFEFLAQVLYHHIDCKWERCGEKMRQQGLSSGTHQYYRVLVHRACCLASTKSNSVHIVVCGQK